MIGLLYYSSYNKEVIGPIGEYEMDKREQILELLGKGIAPAIICSTVSVTPSYISTLQEDPEFSAALEAMLLESQLAASLRDESLDELEAALLVKVAEVLPYITKPMEAVRALKEVNSMKRRGLVHNMTQGMNVHKEAVVVELPSYLEKAPLEVQVSSANEIVAVEGKNMVTMPTRTVVEKLLHKQTEEQTQVALEHTGG